MKINNLKTAIFTAVAAISLQGCVTDGIVETDVDTGDPARENSLLGQIVDAKTGTPINGATITFYNTGIKYTATSITSTDAQLNGSFKMSGLRQTSQPGYFMVEADGYASIISDPSMGDGVSIGDDQEYIVEDLLRIGLGQAVNMPIQLTDEEGSQVANAKVYAVSSSGSNCAYNDGMVGTSAASVTTDASGQATISISDCQSYNFHIPGFDADGDGTYDYQTSWEGLNIDTHEAGTTLALVIDKLELSTDLLGSVIDSSLDDNEDLDSPSLTIYDAGTAAFGTSVTTYNNGGSWPTSPTQVLSAPEAIVMILRTPATLTYNLADDVTSRNFFADPDTDDDGSEQLDNEGNSVYGATSNTGSVSLDSTGTILTVAPPANGWSQQTVISASIRLDNHSAITTYEDITPQYQTASFTAYVRKTTAAFASGFSVSADNYDGEGTDSAGDSGVYLEFSDYVEGNYRVLSTTTGSTTTTVNGGVNTIGSGFRYSDGNTDTSDNVCNDCGTGKGAVFTDYTGQLLDNGDSIRVHLDATDLAGNHVNQVLDITVQ